MPSYLHATPLIKWGAALANTLTIGFPLDDVRAWDEPRDGSETTQAPSGVEEGWDAGTDYLLEGSVGWIPQEDESDPSATGWDGETGFRAFLAWARMKRVFRFFPDAGDDTTYFDCYLVEPSRGAPDPEPNGQRRVRLKMRQSASPFDGY